MANKCTCVRGIVRDRWSGWNCGPVWTTTDGDVTTSRGAINCHRNHVGCGWSDGVDVDVVVLVVETCRARVDVGPKGDRAPIGNQT